MTKQSKAFITENWLSIVFAVALAIAIGGLLYLMSLPNPSAREVFLQSILLTVASIVTSILATKVYGEWTYSQHLRDRGVQIAAGVMVLKRQLGRLATWVTDKRDSLDAESLPRVEGVLDHVEESLLSFQDMTEATLGEIAGVIGDALAQYEAIMEQISSIRLEEQKRTHAIQREIQSTSSTEEVATLQAEIQQIRAQTERQVLQLARTSALPVPSTAPRRAVTVACPACSEPKTEEMAERAGETKGTRCFKCGCRFNMHIGSDMQPFARITAAPLSIASRIAISSISADDFRVQAREHLRRGGSLLYPEALPGLSEAVAVADRQLRDAGVHPSPSLIETTLSADQELLAKLSIPPGAVRAFISTLYRSRLFRFPPAIVPSVQASYLNTLTAEAVARAFVAGCVFRLSFAFDVTLETVPRLRELLVPEALHTPATAWIEDAIRRTAMLPSVVAHASGTAAGAAADVDPHNTVRLPLD